MKKNIVLFILFILPIVAYLFFASGINSFAKLPTITKNIPELNNWKTLDDKPVKLTNKITFLGFIDPLKAALFHAVSDIAILINSAKLANFKLKK